uniref:Replication-associated protein ORF2 n=1 Tax=Spiroplasma virus 4 TaxID=2928746 RepID=REP_SPV4|nr:RecName: Full=Replication-associated protein ORF2; AltName: Full=Rep [Spiroplasma phage 4]
MACLRPLQVHNLKKGEKVNFKHYSNGDVARYDMNKNYIVNDSVPCRKCVGCRLDNSAEWGVRASLEIKSNPKHNWFVTLTYSDEHLVYNALGRPNCVPEHITKFIKSLRKYFERRGHIGIKYLASNEYGTKRMRPHYHICFFNLPLDDLEKTIDSQKGYQQWTSKTISRFWDKGFHTIGELTYHSANYTARYTTKKLGVKDYKALQLVPEKLRMSKGIGLKYFMENKERIYKEDSVLISTDKGIKRFKVPKYFDRRMEREWQDEFYLDYIKEKREKVAKRTLFQRQIVSSRSYTDYLGDEQKKLNNIVKRLTRPLKTGKK